MRDLQGRSIEYVRVSITDKCNLRCLYCMPESGVGYIPHGELLSFQEIRRAVACMAGLGIHAVRLTGGEPMARRGCLELVSMLKQTPGIDRVTMTSNGILLRGRVAEAVAAGLDALNLSVDSLSPEVYARMTRGGNLADALSTLHEALECGLSVRLNVVPVRGLNEDDLCALAGLARTLSVDVRFIELMPVGRGGAFEPVPMDEVRGRIEDAFGPLKPDDAPRGLGPAVYCRPEGFTGSLGFIAAISHAFCEGCNRVRLTPEGRLKLCLNRVAGLDLRALMRGGCTDAQLTEAVRSAILEKPARHGFDEPIPDRDPRGMNRIGG